MLPASEQLCKAVRSSDPVRWELDGLRKLGRESQVRQIHGAAHEAWHRARARRARHAREVGIRPFAAEQEPASRIQLENSWPDDYGRSTALEHYRLRTSYFLRRRMRISKLTTPFWSRVPATETL